MKVGKFLHAVGWMALATPLLLAMLAFGQGQSSGAKPVAKAPPRDDAARDARRLTRGATRATKDATQATGKLAVKRDATFERYVDLRLLAEAMKSLDPAMLADVALQFAEGERILLRGHNSISTDEVLEFAIRVAGQKRDEKTLARLGHIVTQRGGESLTAQWKAAQSLSSESRSDSNASAVSVLKTSPREFAEYQKILRYIADRKVRGNLAALKEFQARLPGLTALGDANRQAVAAVLADAISKIPESAAAVNQKLLLLSAKSRDDDYGGDDYGGDDYGGDDYGGDDYGGDDYGGDDYGGDDSGGDDYGGDDYGGDDEAASSDDEGDWGDSGPGEDMSGDSGPGEDYPGDSGSGEGMTGDPGPGEDYPGDSGPGEGMPGDPGPGEDYPGNPGPGEGMTGDPGPGEGMTGDPGPGEDYPGNPGPGEGMTGDPGPGEDYPGDPGPGEGMTGDPGPGEDYPGDPGPGEDMPGDPGPGEDYPGDPGPGEDMPGDPGPGEDYPGDPGPGDDYPGDTGPGDDNPGRPETGGSKPPRKVGIPRFPLQRRTGGGVPRQPSAGPSTPPSRNNPPKLGFRPIRLDSLSRYPDARVPKEFANPSREYLLANTTTVTNASNELFVVFQEDGSRANREVLGLLDPGASFDLVGFVGKSLSFATVTPDHQVRGIHRLKLIAGGMRLTAANSLSGGSRQLTNNEQRRLEWNEVELELARNFGELYPGEIQDLEREINRIKATGALRAIRNALFILAQVPGGRLFLNIAVLPPPFPPMLISVLGNWRDSWAEMLPRPGFQSGGRQGGGTGGGNGGSPIAGNGSTGKPPRSQNPPANSRPPSQGASPGGAPPASIVGTFVQYLSADKSVRRVYVFFKNNKDFSYYREVKHDDVWFAEKDTMGVYRYAKGSLQMTIPSKPAISFQVVAPGKGRVLTLTDSKSTQLQWDRLK
jgi:hypothetical protein